MRILGLVPARGGSLGVPRKNIIDLGGKPLIQWTADVACSTSLDRVVLSTDDEEIASVGRAVGLEVPFMRPAELAGPSVRSIDVVLHALSVLNEKWDAVMLLQPTTPFRTIEDVEGCIQMLGRGQADSVISVTSVGGHHPARMKLVDESGLLVDPPYAEESEGMPRQELPDVYIKNGAVYLTRTEVLARRQFQGSRCLAWVMPSSRSVNIDDEIDLLVARAIASSRS